LSPDYTKQPIGPAVRLEPNPSLEVRNTSIVRRLTNRLSLFPMLSAKMMGLLPFVSPVTSVDELLKQSKSGSYTLDLTGSGYVEALACPDGKRIYLKHAFMQTTSGACQIKVKVNRDSSILSWEPTSTTGRQIEFYGQPIEEGGSIGVGATGNAGDGSRKLILFYEEEDAF